MESFNLVTFQFMLQCYNTRSLFSIFQISLPTKLIGLFHFPFMYVCVHASFLSLKFTFVKDMKIGKSISLFFSYIPILSVLCNYSSE